MYRAKGSESGIHSLLDSHIKQGGLFWFRVQDVVGCPSLHSSTHASVRLSAKSLPLTRFRKWMKSLLYKIVHPWTFCLVDWRWPENLRYKVFQRNHSLSSVLHRRTQAQWQLNHLGCVDTTLKMHPFTIPFTIHSRPLSGEEFFNGLELFASSH